MTKLAIYRNNSAYTQFLAPAIASRNDFETKVFAEGTPEAEITAWITENATKIRSMEEVYTDNTCSKAGRSVSSTTGKSGNIWRDVKNNYGNLDYNFSEASRAVFTKTTTEETVTEVVARLIAKEVPTKVLIIQDHMADHDLFGLGITSSDWKAESERDAEKLRLCLREVIGQPVFYLDVSFAGLDAGVSLDETDIVWVFLDRHYKGCEKRLWSKIPANWKQFRVPVENLIEDAVAFGIEIDTLAYSRAIRDIVATW